MRLNINEETKLVNIEMPFFLTFNNTCDRQHEEIAKAIHEDIKSGKKIKTHMIIIESETLADEHWDDPAYMHKTNRLIISEAVEEARRELTNKYYNQDELSKFMQKHKLHTWKYNFKEEEKDKRKFKLEIEDAIFEYQVTKAMVENMVGHLELAKYKLDEYGYPIEKEEGAEDYDNPLTLETDPDVVEKQKEILLERLLAPRMLTEHNRVYDMPHPFSHWDSRSFYHNFFFVENAGIELLLYSRGCSGSSGAREENGKWAHTFAYLAKEYGIETPTYHLQYDSHNKLRLINKYDEFKCFWNDLSGNYFSDHETVEKLFGDKENRIIECVRKFDF